jgi:hypothetical protein
MQIIVPILIWVAYFLGKPEAAKAVLGINLSKAS